MKGAIHSEAIPEEFSCSFSLPWIGNHLAKWPGGSERHWRKTTFFYPFQIQKNYFPVILILRFQELCDATKETVESWWLAWNSPLKTALDCLKFSMTINPLFKTAKLALALHASDRDTLLGLNSPLWFCDRDQGSQDSSTEDWSGKEKSKT